MVRQIVALQELPPALHIDPITEPWTVLWLLRPFLIRIHCHHTSKPDSPTETSFHLRWHTKNCPLSFGQGWMSLPSQNIKCFVHTNWPGPERGGPVTLEEPLCRGPSPRLDRYSPGRGIRLLMLFEATLVNRLLCFLLRRKANRKPSCTFKVIGSSSRQWISDCQLMEVPLKWRFNWP